MTGQPGRFPEGEPSVKSVLSALVRAHKRAMAKAAAAADAQGSLEAADDATAPTTHADLSSAASAARDGR